MYIWDFDIFYIKCVQKTVREYPYHFIFVSFVFLIHHSNLYNIQEERYKNIYIKQIQIWFPMLYEFGLAFIYGTVLYVCLSYTLLACFCLFTRAASKAKIYCDAYCTLQYNITSRVYKIDIAGYFTYLPCFFYFILCLYNDIHK